MERPLVSIIISNHNYDKYIKYAIESALSQTYSFKEVIIVDDGSTDNSKEIISSFKNEVNLIFKENGGQASALNAGFQASKGEVILFLDSDDFFRPYKADNIVEAFINNPDALWCFNQLRVLDEKSQQLLGCYPKPPDFISDSIIVDSRPLIMQGVRPSYCSPSSGQSYKRELLEKILPMPEIITRGADGYTGLVSMFLEKGIFLEKDLTIQRLHGDNAFSGVNERKVKGLDRNMLRAPEYRLRYPEMRKLANKLFAISLGNIIAKKESSKYEEIIFKYLSNSSFTEKFNIFLRATYHYAKSKIKF